MHSTNNITIQYIHSLHTAISVRIRFYLKYTSMRQKTKWCHTHPHIAPWPTPFFSLQQPFAVGLVRLPIQYHYLPLPFYIIVIMIEWIWSECVFRLWTRVRNWNGTITVGRRVGSNDTNYNHSNNTRKCAGGMSDFLTFFTNSAFLTLQLCL